MEAQSVSSRRGLLGRGLLVAAGVLGIGGAVRHSTASGTPATTTATSSSNELKLYGRNVHLHSPDRRSGELPRKGDRHTAYGELLDAPEGAAVGHFSAARMALDSPFAAASSLEIHTFDLGDGTLHGLGSAVRGADGNFVILGGTGRYAGATGTYLARQEPRELGGDGTAEFHLTLAGLEVGHGL
jgi:hypothetical protein